MDLEPQTLVVLTVVEGQNKGKSFRFTEPDNFLLGRDASGSHAHFKVTSEDKLVSRNHFLLEINPPDCFLRDAGSLNGTFIAKLKKKTLFYLEGRERKYWKEIAEHYLKKYECDACQEAKERIELEDGDIIIVGETTLEVKITQEMPETPGETPIIEPGVLHCIRCGANIDDEITRKEVEKLTSTDFVCEKCLKKNEKSEKSSSKVAIRCDECGKKDLTSLANSDGRVEELQDIAIYWCKECAFSMKQEVPLSQIGDYVFIKGLGIGGFGAVYLAWQETTGRVTALKLTKEKIKRDRRLVERFMREIAIMREFRHPNLVRLYGDGISEQDSLYFVSEYLPEGSLADVFTNHYDGKMPYGEACDFIAQALEGLAYFHEKGYVHRDLKPENILIRKNEEGKLIAKVGDFGLAKSYVLHGGTITKTGEWAGTLFYCPPEQIKDFKSAKPWTDVYAMGVSLYFLITGEFPYDFPNRKKFFEMISRGEKPKDALSIILGKDQPMPIEKKAPDIPKDLAKTINRAIKKDAAERFSSVDEFRKALERHVK